MNKMINELNQLITKKPVDGTKEYARLLKDAKQIKLASAVHNSNMCLIPQAH